MKKKTQPIPKPLPKTPSGIRGLDEVTGGGLPTGRPTLVCGTAGSGKTLIAMEFLVNGAVRYGEPGVMMTFEETAGELAENVASLGFDVEALIAARKLTIDHVQVERNEIEETGEYNLEGLFIRLDYAIKTVSAKRVVLDTVEVLFSQFPNTVIVRSELRRLFRWLKDRGVTAIITCEAGDGRLTRHGIEEYVSDCVIVLDHRVTEQLSTRRLRVAKYRGSLHATNEFPFLIDEHGISILPVTSMGLDHLASEERVSTGIPGLDTMLAGKGFYRGSTILVSGAAGSGKTSIAAQFVDAACRRGERCLFFLFDESPSQVMRNMRSIGLNLEPWVDGGLLRFHAARPTQCGLETHLVTAIKEVEDHKPSVVVVDPISTLTSLGSSLETRAMLTRLVDYLKVKQLTSLMISLMGSWSGARRLETQVSTLVDTWLLLSETELDGQRNRGLCILKSRGMAHSSQIREFRLTGHGIELAGEDTGHSGG